MRLAELEARLRERLSGTLPGVDAQIPFAPFPRSPGWRAGEFPVGARVAAALLCLYPVETGVAFPLTVRASTLARHAGQISLPGGATDPAKPREAALREARRKSASIRHRSASSRAHADPRARGGFTLHPVVGVTDVRPAFRPAPGEVEAIVEVPLEDLQDASRIRTGTRQREGVEVEYAYLDLGGHQVWGATAMVLGEFIQLLI